MFLDSGQSIGSDGEAVKLGDIDGDGDLDAIISGNETRVYVNQGGIQGGQPGVFLDAGQTLGSNTFVEGLGDVDGDGDLDAFLVGGDTFVFLNQGGAQGGQAGVFLDSGQRLGDGDSFAVGLGDLDNDGDLDAFVVNADGQNQVFLNQGGLQGGEAGIFVDSGQLLGPATGSSSVALGDVDGDGDLDAVLGAESGPALVLLNQTNAGNPALFVDSGQTLGNASFDVSLGDLDEDGFLDLIVAGSGSSGFVSVFLNDGANQAGQFIATGQTLGSEQSLSVNLCDLDGDGHLDAYVGTLALNPNNSGDRILLGRPSAWTSNVDEVADTFTFDDGAPRVTGGAPVTYQAAWGTPLIGLKDGETYFAITSDSLPADTIRISPTQTGALTSDGQSNLVRFHIGSMTPGGTHYLGIEGLGITQPGSDLIVGSQGTFDPTELDGEDGFSVSGVDDNEQVGSIVTGVGDLDGDGYNDFVVVGQTPYLVYGFDDPGTGDYPINDPKLGGVPIGVGGQIVGRVGDLNGDGYDDLVIGDPSANSGAGMVSIVLGSSERFTGSIDLPDSVVLGENEGDQFGASLVGANLNNDRFDDLVVGAPGAEGGDGKAYVLFGGENRIGHGLTGAYFHSGSLQDADEAAQYIADNAPDATFVSSQLNYPRTSDTLNDANRLSTYLDSDASTLVGTDARSLNASTFSYDGFLVVETAGTYQFELGADDGARLIIDGEIVADKTKGAFGTTAHDYTFDQPGLYPISVVHFEDGGNTGVDIKSDLGGSLEPLTTEFLRTVAWDLSELDGTTGFVLDGAGTDAALGAAVGAAGDINSDTIADVIVGAPGTAAAYVLFGSTSPYTESLDVATFTGNGSGVTLEGDLNSQTGFSVNGAGDINGDGLDDVIIGAPAASPDGRAEAGQAFIVFGSAKAFPSSVDLTMLDGTIGFVLNGGAAGDRAGTSVAGVGDINGDSIDDVLIGSPFANFDGRENVGVAYLLFGGQNIGQQSGQILTALGSAALAMTGSDDDGHLGMALSALGDINGDTAPDLIVGARGLPRIAVSPS